jgi:hypothetical protein
MRPNANLTWYTSISKERGVSPRCPFASLSRCPRYFFSASLSKHAGTTGLSKEEEGKFERRWRASEFWSQSPETETSVSGSDNVKSLTRFCPEYIFDIFGVFAESLHPYADSEDKEHTLNMLQCPSGYVSPDWRFTWRNIEERHYTDCPYYSMLSVQMQSSASSDTDKDDLLIAQPGAFGFSMDLKVLLNRFCRWWLKRNG